MKELNSHEKFNSVVWIY